MDVELLTPILAFLTAAVGAFGRHKLSQLSTRLDAVEKENKELKIENIALRGKVTELYERLAEKGGIF